MEYPRLIESSVKNYIQDSLSICHENRIKIYYVSLNIGILILFLGITAVILYYCYNKKKSPYEQHQKMLRDQEYILSKIRFYQTEQHNASSSSITKLPM